MTRLPDEASGQSASGQVFSASGAGSRSASVEAQAHSASATAAKPPLSVAPGGTVATSATRASTQSKLHDRLNKNLSVATAKPKEVEAKQAPKVFRVLAESETIDDLYDFGEEIYSRGEKGKVVVAKRRSDGLEFVVKVRAKNPGRASDRTWRTIMTQMRALNGNMHVLDITEIVEGATEYFIVMPKCNGGELFDFLTTETEVAESECKRITREILTAVGHLHKNNLIHRDIKPENIMFDLDNTQGPSPKTVKLIDFDTCQEWTPATPKSYRFVGTPGYIAPEALLGQLSPQSDLWSIGVILYILMTGEMPWSSLVSLEDGVVGSPGAKQMYKDLKSEVLCWDDEPWTDFPQARDLCQRLLAFNLEERISSVQEALAHPWLAS